MNATTPQALTSAIRAHHRALAETLDTYTNEVEGGLESHDTAPLADLLNKLSSFLSDELLPHAHGEDETLYPALDPVIRAHGSPTATMRVDHEYIAEYARQIAETARIWDSVASSERPELARQLRRQVLQLHGLFAVHLAKEERVYLPLVEQEITDADQQALLAALHDEAAHATTQPASPTAQ